MAGWKSIQKVYRKREILGLVAIAISIMIGAICDWNVLIEKNILIPINDIESFTNYFTNTSNSWNFNIYNHCIDYRKYF